MLTAELQSFFAAETKEKRPFPYLQDVREIGG